MDEGKGGQTLSLQERVGTGSNSESGKEKKNSRKRRKGWACQKAHVGDGVAEASRALSEAVVAVLSASRAIHQRVQALLS